jgi:hypothetical protein
MTFHPRDLIWISVLIFAIYVFRWQVFLVFPVWLAGVWLWRWAILNRIDIQTTAPAHTATLHHIHDIGFFNPVADGVKLVYC